MPNTRASAWQSLWDEVLTHEVLGTPTPEVNRLLTELWAQVGYESLVGLWYARGSQAMMLWQERFYRVPTFH